MKKLLNAVILIPVFLVFVISSFGQRTILDKKISCSFSENKLPEIFDKISDAANISFSYNTDILPLNKDWSFEFIEQPIKKILDTILNDESLKYEILENQIVIFKPHYTPKLEKAEEKSIPDYKQIKGKVVDVTSKKPIPFAHVAISKTSIGTITNIDGEFTFNISNPQQFDSLEVSFVGYLRYSLSLSFLDTSKTLIELAPQTINIKEVIVKPVDPIDVIKKALERIPVNYDSDPVMLTGFFRESIKQNQDYISISEAILSIYKSSYDIEYTNDRIKIIKGRKSQDTKQMAEIEFTVMGGLYYTLKLDFVKDRASFIDPDFFQFYEYQLEDIIQYNGKSTYVIAFDQRKDVDQSFYTGRIYVDIESLAFIGTEFYLSKRALENSASMFVKKKPFSFRVNPVYAHYRVDYRFLNNKWYLNNARGDINFLVKSNRKNVNSVFSLVSEFLIANRDSSGVKKFKLNEVSKATDVFVEQIMEYDESFWGKYNVIKPDISIQEACKKLNMNQTIILINREEEKNRHKKKK